METALVANASANMARQQFENSFPSLSASAYNIEDDTDNQVKVLHTL
jgi:hypothetical protein